MANIIAQLAPLWQKLEQERNLPLGYLDRLAKVESSYNPNARNPKSSAGGLYQFIDSTAGRYGLTDKFDPFASSEAAARLAADNAAHLRKNGIEPDAGNLYLAHQQGPAGAVKLLRGGDAPASSVVGGAEAGLNGGGGKSASGMANMWRSKFSDVGGGAATNAAPPTEGQTDMAGAADLPAPGAVQAGGASQFAIPGATPFAGKEAAGGMDWDTLMMGMALLANAIPNGTPAKDMGSIMAPFLTAQSKRDDRRYQRSRDDKSDSQWQRSFDANQGNRTVDNARADASLEIQRDAAKRAWQAEERNNAKPLIQKFEDAAGNPTYKQFDVTSKQWVPLSDGGASAGVPAQAPPPSAPPTAGSPAMDGVPPTTMGAPSAPRAMPGIVPPPPGVNREQWYKDQTSRLAAEAGGPKTEEITSLRKEIQSLPSYKNLSQAAPIYNGMLDAAGRNSKASDLNLVYGLGKIMDPTSVVREGEMIMVKNSAGLSEQVLGAINSLNGGAALTPETREAIMREAHGRVKSYEQQYQQDTKQYSGIVERRKMDPRDVINDFGQFNPWQKPQTSATPGAASGGTTGDGRQTKVVNGKTYVKEKNSSSWFEE